MAGPFAVIRAHYKDGLTHATFTAEAPAPAPAPDPVAALVLAWMTATEAQRAEFTAWALVEAADLIPGQPALDAALAARAPRPAGPVELVRPRAMIETEANEESLSFRGATDRGAPD